MHVTQYHCIKGAHVRKEPSIVIILYLLISLMVVGTVGYVILLDIPLIEGLYMTVITISTVGYREVRDLDSVGKLFTIFLILGGLGTVAYAFTRISAFLVEGEFQKSLRKRNSMRRVSLMKNHYIVCGASQTSMSVVEQFKKYKAEYVIIEQSDLKCEELLNQGYTVIRGDATQEEILEQAGIKHAEGLVTCLDSDSENVFVVLTAREMKPDIHIVARAIDKHAPQKLRKAGADTTISPNELGGTRMAFLMLRPNVMAFLDAITHVGEELLDLGEVTITESSSLKNQTLREAKIPEKTGLIVIAIKHGEDKMLFNPSSQEVLTEGSSMLVLGKQHEIDTLKKIADA